MNDAITWLLGELDSIAGAVLSFLPDSPFQTFYPTLNDPDFNTWISWFNWFFPMSTFISIAESWLTCIAGYYIVQTILRWAKVIE